MSYVLHLVGFLCTLAVCAWGAYQLGRLHARQDREGRG